jgi:hypothetical protein
MVDDKFHTYRNRDSVARVERKRTSRRETTDTLVELARLIEQGDLHANGSRYDAHSPARSADGGSSRLNWVAENMAGHLGAYAVPINWHFTLQETLR